MRFPFRYCLMLLAVCFFETGWALDIDDKMYGALSDYFSQRDCKDTSPSAPGVCDAHSFIKDGKVFASASEQVLKDRFIDEELKRLECVSQRWQSMEKQPDAQSVQTQQINAMMPELRNLQEEIHKLGRQLDRSQGPGATWVLQTQARSGANRSRAREAMAAKGQAQENILNQIQQLQGQMDAKLETLMDGNNEVVRGAIMKQIQQDPVAPITPQTFRNLTTLARQSMESTKQLFLAARTPEGVLPIEQQKRLFNDPELIATVLQSDPTALSALSRLQCQVAKRAETEESTETIVSTSTLFFGGIARAVGTKAGQTLLRLRTPASVVGWQRVAGVFATGALGMDTLIQTKKECETSAQAQTTGSCSITAESLQREHNMKNCIYKAAIVAASTGTGKKVLAAAGSKIAPAVLDKFRDPPEVAKKLGTGEWILPPGAKQSEDKAKEVYKKLFSEYRVTSSSEQLAVMQQEFESNYKIIQKLKTSTIADDQQKLSGYKAICRGWMMLRKAAKFDQGNDGDWWNQKAKDCD